MSNERKSHAPSKPSLDQHHLLWDRKTWNSNPSSKSLRDFWYCKIEIPRDLHSCIHRSVPHIPPPDAIICQEILIQLRQLDHHHALQPTDSITKRLRIIEFCVDLKGPTIFYIKQQIAAVKGF